MGMSLDRAAKRWLAQEKREQKGESMQPALWQPPIEPSAAEQAIIKRIRRAKLFVFLRQHRHTLFTDAFQQELAGLYRASQRGQPPIPPAQLALATLLQAYTGASDDEVIEALTMDRRWQLVLDCLDTEEPPFSKGTLIAFRNRLIASQLDRRLIERTIEVARETGAFGDRPLRAALDSSPLWGAGRVEDTYNLLGHALRKALSVIARQQGRGLTEVAAEANADLLAGSSLKAALDRDWDDPAEREKALEVVLAVLTAVERWLETQPEGREEPAVKRSLAAAQQVKQQDVQVPQTGTAVLRKGVAKDRRISIEDAQMRHGRKSRSVRVDGYKRHVLHDLDTGLVRAVGITAANAAEASVTEDIAADLSCQRVRLAELHIDRAYLSSSLVRERAADLQVYCKAWPVRTGTRFPKTAFELDWERHLLRCPNQQEIPFVEGGVVRFPADICQCCPLRERCTSSRNGRSVSIHPDERLLQELRERQLTPLGRAKLRERVAVEHTLAHIGHWQGRRARYRGSRKNLFDLRRCAVIHNLHIIARLPAISQAA
jgi:transposase